MSYIHGGIKGGGSHITGFLSLSPLPSALHEVWEVVFTHAPFEREFPRAGGAGPARNTYPIYLFICRPVYHGRMREALS